ncbi:MAG: phytanoyl-CoA dioxygenase family protein [Myxococcota bacterium]
MRAPEPASFPDFEAHAREIETEGFTLLRDVIAPELVAELREGIYAHFERLGVPFGSNTFLGERTRRLFNLLGRDRLFEQIPLHPAVLPLAEAVLDRELLLSSLTAIEMQSGETAQPIHADDGSIAVQRPHTPFNCTAIWALTDFTPENGATRVVRGSHLVDRRPSPGEQPECELATMTAGSALVYHGSLWHGGGANRSQAPRLGVVVNYCAGFLRQEECQLLALPRERVANFDPRLRAMVGYGLYRGLFGHIDQRDPATFIDPDAESDMIWDRLR